MTQSSTDRIQHTPGPWRFRAPPSIDKGNPWVVLDKDSHVLAIVSRSPREANARLIAAAPRMLDLLEQLLDTALPSSTLRVPSYIVEAVKDVLREVYRP